MRLIKLFIFFIIVSPVVLLPQTITKTGSTAAQFLKVGVGSRALGMGGAFTATSDDINATYWNPAGLSGITSNEVTFNHINWLADINLDYAGFATSIPGFGTLGAFVTVLSTEDMMVRTIDRPEGTGEYFTYNTLSIGLSYARNLTDNFSIGFNAKYIGENLWHMNATGFAIDIGTLYKIQILNEFRIAASISNFGTKMRMNGRDALVIKPVGSGDANLINTNVELDAFDLPLMFRFGIASDLIKTSYHRLTAEVDAIHPNDHTEYLNTGFEYSWNEIFYMRGGYSSIFERDTEKGLTFGFGLNYRLLDFANIKVDYAYQDMHRLNNVQYISVGLKF
ncbi:MAG: PorV/PorQ family protein [Ignavibacteriales bacterium]